MDNKDDKLEAQPATILVENNTEKVTHSDSTLESRQMTELTRDIVDLTSDEPGSVAHLANHPELSSQPAAVSSRKRKVVMFGDVTELKISVSRSQKSRSRRRLDVGSQPVLNNQSTILKCRACDLNNDAEYVHPVLNVPICGRCNKMYKDAHFDVDKETGNCWECIMCGVGDGNWMFMCDSCPNSFCQRCMTASVGLVEAERVRALKEWTCYICTPTEVFKNLQVPKDFTFFNIESVYTSVRPPARKDAQGAYEVDDPWSRPIVYSRVPHELVEQLSTGERTLASLFSTQTSSVIPMLKIADRFLTARDISCIQRVSAKMRAFFRHIIVTPGLFKTPFGEENACMLHPHQNVSLRWMSRAENQTEEFGALRGGILADAPGLGKTVSMLALVSSSAGQMPVEPNVFWDSEALEELWAARGGSSESNYRCVEGAIRDTIKNSDLRIFPYVLTAEAIRKRFEAGEFASLSSFEIAFRAAIRYVAAGDPRLGEMLQHSFRRGMIVAKASMDRRSRASFQSPQGMRMLLERSLHPSSATLIVVPMALLEHWFEQIKRHINLDFCGHRVATPQELREAEENGLLHLTSASDVDALSGRRGIVYFDGLGDILDVSAPLPRLRQGGIRKNALELSQYLIVVTTFERCASLHRQNLQKQSVERALSSSSRRVSSRMQTSLELSQVRWLRLVVDEGHELGAQSEKYPETITPTTSFIRDLAAERRWVMSGTPTTGTKSSAALAQIQRLLAFLRHQEWGATLRAEESWQRRVAQPFLRQEPAARELLKQCLEKIMIRHNKQDLHLFEPIRKTVVLDAEEEKEMLERMDLRMEVEVVRATDETDDNQIDKLKAKFIYATVSKATKQWKETLRVQDTRTKSTGTPRKSKDEQATRRPKVIVFSTDKAHLAGVGHFLYLWMGDRGVCEHGGTQDETVGAAARKYMAEMRSAELSRFRTSRRKWRACPLCGGENFITSGDSCTKTLLLVEYEEEVPVPTLQVSPEVQPAKARPARPSSGFGFATYNPFTMDSEYSEVSSDTGRSRESITQRVPIPSPARGGHGASGRGSFYSGECLCSPMGCRVEGRPKGYCSLFPNPFYYDRKTGQYRDGEVQVCSRNGNDTRGVDLALVAEEHIRGWVPGRRFLVDEEVYVNSSDAHVELVDTDETHDLTAPHPVPLLWRQGRLGGRAKVRAWKRCGKGGGGHSGWHSGKHILERSPWIVEEEEASVLLLQEDGSTGLDLSFATHIFLLNQLRDPALESQIISRAHRMGAAGPVSVILLLANELEENELRDATAAAIKNSEKNAL